MLMLIVLIGLSGCASLPPRPDLDWEYSRSPAETGALAALSSQFEAENGGDISGFKFVLNAREALEARLALIDLATSSIDLQYFIWQGDATGILLFHRLLMAADRGVKIRLLVDDIGVASSTRNLAALNSHPNLEIRVYNPNPSRDYTVAGMLHFLASMKELNRRMHNKLMIADNHVSITGGRNIGNPYFGLGKKYNFLDLDIIALGAVIEESSRAFDAYWNNKMAYPVSGWGVKLQPDAYEQMRRGVDDLLVEHRDQLESYPLDPKDWQAWITDLGQNLINGEAHFLQDDPVKIKGRDYRLIDMISYVADPSEEELILVSPYFIPVGDGLKNIGETVDNGIEVRIVTNSLASTNHTLVNSHYKKYRRSILDTGAQLFEFRHQPSKSLREQADVMPVEAPFISMHMKVVVSDRRKCFIGSLNFDPRALVINSENGMLIESEELASKLADFLGLVMEPQNSYHLMLTEDQKVMWQAADKTLSGQPSRGLMQSLGDFFGRFLPIEGQL